MSELRERAANTENPLARLAGESVLGGAIKSGAALAGASGTATKMADIIKRDFTSEDVFGKRSELAAEMDLARSALRRGDVRAAQARSASIGRQRDEVTALEGSLAAQALLDNKTPLARAANKMDAIYENLNAKGNEHTARAQAGQDVVGRLASDLITTGTQVLGDAAVNTVVPGSGLASLGTRAFGDASQRARLGGASVGEQAAYGGAVAAVEVLTEKMFDGLAGIYGKGNADKIAEKTIQKLTKDNAGRAALTIAAGAGGEAIEEIVAGAVEPALGSIYNGKSPLKNYSVDTVSDIAHDALVAGILGGVGGGTQTLKSNLFAPIMEQTNSTGQFWTRISNYVDKSISKSRFIENPVITDETVADFELGKISKDLAKKLEVEYGINLNGYEHVLTDNDIRHIYNRHGPHTKEKIPVTATDIKNIPAIIRYADEVYYLPRDDGKAGLMYQFNTGYTTYYLEQIVDSEKKLRNKQMIKVPTGEIPDIKGLREAIYKKSINPLPSDAAKAVPQMYAQSVRDDASTSVPQFPDAVKPPTNPPLAYAALLKRLAAGKIAPTALTPQQRKALEAWNNEHPEMQMTEEEFLER